MPKYYPPSQTIDSEYAVRRNEAIQKEVPDAQKFVARTMQQHHDYFVQKYRDAIKAGIQLNSSEMNDFEIAMIRERKGIVEPLL